MCKTNNFYFAGILEERIKIVLGIDVGHGESAGCYVRIRNDDGTPVANPETHLLKVNSKEDTKIFSTIEYTDSGVAIGGYGGNVIAYFKKSPADWDNTEPVSGKTYRTLMGDFIKKLTDCLLSPDYNPVLGKSPRDEIAVFVGCPSDEVWVNEDARTAYAELISEVTGITNVNVVAESTAAIFSTVGGENDDLKVSISEGVAVFDFGSSTSDFTYVLLGKTLAEKSWTLGASAIEKIIYEKVLLDEGIETEHVYQGNLDALYLKTRMDIKEDWYGDSINPGIKDRTEGCDKAISYTPCDEFGTPQKRPNGSLIMKSLDFYLYDEFMSSVEKNMTIGKIKEKGEYIDSEEASWYENCRQFVIACQNALKTKDKPLKKVIITGGASRMDFIREICNEVFATQITDNGLEIVNDPSPSYCVCRGLCQIAINNLKVAPVVSDQIENTRDKSESCLKTYKKDILDGLTDYVLDSYIHVLENECTVQNTVAEYKEKIQVYIEKNLNADKIKEITTKPLETLNDNLSKNYVRISENVAKKLYGDDVDCSCFAVNLKTLQNNINVKIEIDEETIDKAVTYGLKKIGETMGYIVMVPLLIILCIVYSIPLIGDKIGVWLDEKFGDVLDAIPGVNPDKLKIKNKDKIKSNLRGKRGNIRDSLNPVMVEIVSKQFGENNGEYYKAVEENINKLVRVVALEHFDERIQI